MEQSQGSRLRNLRERQNSSQKQFANQIGYRQSHLSELENDKSKITVEMLETLYGIFRYSPNYHILGIGEMIILESEISIGYDDSKISETMIEERKGIYQTNTKGEEIENKTKKILEENWTLRRLVETLKTEKTELNNRLISAQDKIIALLERPIHAQV